MGSIPTNKYQSSLSLGICLVLCKRQKESQDSIDENIDLHKEYLDELDFTSVAKVFAEKFDGNMY